MNEKIEIRDKVIDGETDWHWVKHDEGAFSGPSEDWETGFKEIYENDIPKRGTIITAGANCGMYVRFYAKLFDHVYAFEPDNTAFECMVLNNPGENVYKLNAFLGENSGVAGIARSDSNNYGIHHISYHNKKQRIPVMTIDSLNLPECDVIQLDVEGFELDVLQGATETIRKHQPIIQLERFVNPEHRAYMQAIGYVEFKRARMDVFYKMMGT